MKRSVCEVDRTTGDLFFIQSCFASRTVFEVLSTSMLCKLLSRPIQLGRSAFMQYDHDLKSFVSTPRDDALTRNHRDSREYATIDPSKICSTMSYCKGTLIVNLIYASRLGAAERKSSSCCGTEGRPQDIVHYICNCYSAVGLAGKATCACCSARVISSCCAIRFVEVAQQEMRETRLSCVSVGAKVTSMRLCRRGRTR